MTLTCTELSDRTSSAAGAQVRGTRRGCDCEATRGFGNRDACRRRRRGMGNLPVLSARARAGTGATTPQQLSQPRSPRARAPLRPAGGCRGVPWSWRRRAGREVSLGVTRSVTEVRGRMREGAPRIPGPCFLFLLLLDY